MGSGKCDLERIYDFVFLLVFEFLFIYLRPFATIVFLLNLLYFLGDKN